jgi:hypothetical protein
MKRRGRPLGGSWREETGIVAADLEPAAVAGFSLARPARREYAAVYRLVLRAVPQLSGDDEVAGFPVVGSAVAAARGYESAQRRDRQAGNRHVGTGYPSYLPHREQLCRNVPPRPPSSHILSAVPAGRTLLPQVEHVGQDDDRARRGGFQRKRELHSPTGTARRCPRTSGVGHLWTPRQLFVTKSHPLMGA